MANNFATCKNVFGRILLEDINLGHFPHITTCLLTSSKIVHFESQGWIVGFKE